MKVLRSPKIFQALMDRERGRARTLGFVPTMGALHEGHASLVRRAKKENDLAAVSIFVNPLQFGPKEDFSRYPRTLAADMAVLRKAGADYLFVPKAEDFYPQGFQTSVRVGREGVSGLTRGLCASARPGHFEGVATVVTKLLNLSKAHRAYFGAKDFQQAALIERLVEDLSLDIQIRVCPTVREADGLAMSSRNRYLNSEERSRALALPRALSALKRALEEGRPLGKTLRSARRSLEAGADRVDYLEIVDPGTLEPLKRPRALMTAAAACRFGKTRLIDNVSIRISQTRRK
ncbi:MAG: pantoate--beta-alanine ligase [Candidatus Omnitrophica bacterium]|nr:pantoate--beta-alanine ligase [Candidatus Omnitrophota bacterium]